MLFYLVTRAHAYTFETHLETWGRALRPRMRPIYYDQLPHRRSLPRGTYLFADLERLDDVKLELATAAWGALASAGVRVMNAPPDVLRRAPLLAALYAAGLNSFAAHRADGDLSRVRFPAFVRRENEHDGSLSELVRTPDELAAAIAAVTARGYPPRDLLVIEYCRTADADGVFRKFSAFRAGGRIVPRHLFHGRNWVLKYADLVTDATLAEETDYLHTHPHEAQLTRIFNLARIDYGRIDYGLLDGRIQTFEINTNPMIAVDPMQVAPSRLANLAHFCKGFHEAMASADSPDDAGPPIPFAPPAALLRRLGIRRRDQWARAAGNALRGACKLRVIRRLLRASAD